MSLKRTALILSLAVVCSIAPSGFGPVSPASAASDYYASCTTCHPLPLLQAQGEMGIHNWNFPQPGYIDDNCMMQCHQYTPPEGHDWPADGLYYWQYFLDPVSYPPGPSVSQQMCATCHAVGFPPLDSLHTHDQIPYLPSATTPPPSVLPLYQGDGPWNQDPNMGGLVCSTCHDPHDPSYVASSNGRPSFLRVGDPSGDITPLCATCHTEMGPQTTGYDLYIDSDPLSVWFTQEFTTPEWIDIQVIVRNRGNDTYPGGWMDVQVESEMGGDPFSFGGTSVPSIAPDSSTVVWVPWIPKDALWSGGEAVHFVLDPSPLNPVRNNTFVRSFSIPAAPENLRVDGTDYQSVSISWDPPLDPGPFPPKYDVYRNGIKVTSSPLEWQNWFTDMGLPPETPHTYTVTTVSDEGFSSPMSNRVGALTDWGIAELRVPQDYPTIQSAVDAASPGTTIRVAPGTYSDFMFVGGQQIAIKGQDANVCTIDLTLHGSLDMVGGWSNSLSGFTIKGGEVRTTPLDTISQCVFQSHSGPNIRGGGFVTNSIFDQTSGPAIELINSDDMLTVANSIFMSDYPFMTYDPPELQIYLINSSFPNWGDWNWLPGENNNSENPYYVSPGPPDRYFIDFIYPFWDGGADVGLPYMDAAPDIGVFEANMTYTAKPAANLTADPLGPTLIKLNWSPSPDEDLFPVSYEIYKSEWSDFPGSDDEMVYDTVNPGTTTYDDFSNNQGTTYYYKVRAFTVASSEVSNTASAIAGGTAPTAVDDSYSTDENQSLIVPSPGVIGNDSDPDGDTLWATVVSGPSFAQSFLLNPDGSFDYTPLPGYYGPDSFTYRVDDGVHQSNVATVHITVNFVNFPPDAVDDSYTLNATLSNHSLNVLLNDGDPDGDPLTVTYVWPPSHGGTAVNAGDHIDYQQLPGFVGIETFLYEVTDGNGEFDTAIVTLTLVNDPPVANSDSWSVDEDSTLNVPAPGVLGNDSDPDGSPLTAVIGALPSNAASFSFNPDGSFSYTPSADFNGADTFTYVAHDGVNDSTAAIVTITVSPVNDAPAADDQAVATDEDITAAITLTGSDIDGDPLTYIVAAGPSSGTLSGTAPNLTYTPDADFNGADSFTFIANDGTADSGAGTVSITVNPLNDAPTTVEDVYVLDEDTVLTVAVPGILLNDIDVDGDPLTAVYTGTAPDHGTLDFNADGSFEYTPDPDYNGVDYFTYRAQDGTTVGNWTFVNLVVNNVNDPPVANDDNAVTDEDTVAYVEVLLNDTDIDGSTVSISTWTNGAHGQVVKNASVQLAYLPDPDFNGTDSFTYTARDYGLESNTATVYVTVNAVNDPPGALNRAPVTDEDTPVPVDLIGVDVENDPLTYIVTSAPASGSLSGTAPNITYTPNPDFNGADSFTYIVNDGQVDSNTGTVNITVNPVNDAPVADDQAVATDEEAAVAIILTASDVDGDALTYAVGIGPSSGTLSGTAPNLTYTPDPDFNGSDSFTFTASDGTVDSSTATVSITVNAVNDAPVADDQAVVTDEDTAVAVTLTASDLDGDPLTYAVTAGPANGSLSGTAPNLTYTPNADYNGPDSFTFTANDGTADSNTATVSIAVSAINDAPAADDQAVATDEDTAVAVTLTASDTEGDPLTYTVGTGPSNGSLSGTAPNLTYTPNADFNGPDSFTFTANDGTADSNTATVSITVNAINDAPAADDQAVVTGEDISVAITLTASDRDGDPLTYAAGTGPSNGTLSGTAPNLTYTPNADFNGSDSFTFTANDGTAGSNTATVSITVNAINDAPVADDQAVATDEDTAVAVTLTASDVDGDTLTYTVTGGPSNGTLSGTAPNLTYTPNSNFNDSDSFTFTANDGTADSNTATVSITVNAINDGPVADDQAVATDEDTTVAITLTASDLDGDTLTYAVTGGPANGSLSGTAPNLIYTPSADFNGSDSFTFTANDGTADSNTATVSITVNAINDAPAVTNPGNQNSSEGDTISLAISANDADGDTLSYSATGLPAGLSIDQNSGVISGTLTYDSAGSHGVTVTVSDRTVATNALFTWNVTGVDRMHVQSITTGTYVNKGKTYYTAQVLLLDDEGAPVSGADVTAHWTGANADSTPATLATAGDGTVTFETNGIKKPSGDYIITIDDVVKSGYLYDADGSVTSGQYPPPAQNAPVANDDSYSVDEGTALNVGAPGVLGNDTDAESDPLTAVLAGGPSHGSLNLNSDGSFTYTNDGSETTSDSFTYRANDGTVDSNTATVTIAVNPVNDAPTAADDSASTQQDTAVAVDVLANDSDVDGGTLSVSAITQGDSGTVVNNGSDVTYTPDPGYTGSDSFTYTASDGNGGFDTATVNVTVFAQNDPPTAVGDSAVTDEDTAVVVDVLANDSDPDSDPISVSAVTQGANGSVANNGGDVTYTPDPDFHGSDSFTYDISDGNGGTDSATVSVTVLPVNDAPVAAGDSAVTDENTAVVVDVLANDSDVDGDTLSVLSVTNGSNGTVVNNGTDVTYTPDPGHTGSDSFTYTVSDGNGGTDSATVSITVNSTSNLSPVADAGPDQSESRRQDLTFDGSGSSDPDGTVVSWEWDFDDGNTGSGEVVTHSYRRKGTYTVTLTVTDDQGATDTDTATVTIN